MMRIKFEGTKFRVIYVKKWINTSTLFYLVGLKENNVLKIYVKCEAYITNFLKKLKFMI